MQIIQAVYGLKYDIHNELTTLFYTLLLWGSGVLWQMKRTSKERRSIWKKEQDKYYVS